METYGRRPDLDSDCSRCVASGITGGASYQRLGVGRTMAFYRAPIKANRKLRIRPEPAKVVHHCNFHNAEVEPVRVVA